MQPTTAFSKSSAFTPVKKQSQISDFFGLMQSYARQVVQSGEKIKILENFGVIEMPFFIRLVLNTLFYLLAGCQSIQVAKSIIQQITKNPLSIKIKISLFKILVNIIERRMCSYDSQKYCDQFSFSMIFKTYLLSMFLAVVSQHSDYIQLEKIQQLYTHLVSQLYLSFLPKYMFFLYGGKGQKITKKNFAQKVQQSVKGLNTHFTQGQNLIMRNSQYIKSNPQKKLVLDQIIVVLANLQNKNYVKQSIQKTTDELFRGESQISITYFMGVMEKNIEQKNDHYLWLYFELMRLELQLLECPQLKAVIVKRESLDPCNYYQQSMQKILKKCPYNGHDSCDCKKCQCIRRNRESAKLSQEKKRNALQQVGQLQERIQVLEKKNNTLEEMNAFLIGVLNQVKKHPEFENVMASTFEQISKVIKNQ